MIATAWRMVPLPVQTLAGHQGAIHALALTSDGQQCISGGMDDTLHAWDLTCGALQGTVTGLRSPVQGLATGGAAGDAAHLLSAHRDGRCRLWRLPLAATRESRATGKGPLWAVALAADGSLGLCALHAGSMLPWSFNSPPPVPVFTGHRGPVWALAFVPNGPQVVSGGDDGTVRLWERDDGRLLGTWRGHTGAVYAVAVTPDGGQILSGAGDGRCASGIGTAGGNVARSPATRTRSTPWRSARTGAMPCPPGVTARCASGSSPQGGCSAP